jgi:hypothetical protein
MEQQIEIKASSKEDFERQKAELELIANKSIFREVPPKGKLWNAQFWVFNKLFGWMHRWLNYTCTEVRRFNRHHKFAKNFIIHRGLRFVRWVISKKNTISKFDDIKPEWYNNHLRLFYHSWEQSLDDVWIKQIRAMQQQNSPDNVQKDMTDEQYLDWIKGKTGRYDRSYQMRLLLMQLWITECLEDTVDREHMNMLMMNITHQMMMYYGVSAEEMKKVPKPGQFPVYTSGGPVNPQYFFYGRNIPVWQPNMQPVVKQEEKKEEPKGEVTLEVERQIKEHEEKVKENGKKSKKSKTHKE